MNNVWSSFLVNLEACRLTAGNFTIKWTTSQVYFASILRSPHALPCFDLMPPPSNSEEPPHVCNTFGKPCFWWWKGQWGSYKGTSFISFLKIQVHLFFGCFGICIYCIDSVTSVTFYRLSPSKKYCVIFFIESPLKLMGNAFYFILKALFILKIFQFLSRLFGHAGKMAWLEG